MDNDVLDVEEKVETPPRRRGPPRLGSFVTIAIAILMLFGAASRVGKIPETMALFGIDRQAENRIRQEEERLRAAITLGTIPVRNDPPRSQTALLPVRENVLPPSRGEFDLDEYRNGGRTSVSMVIRNDRQNGEGTEDSPFPGSAESLYDYSSGYSSSEMREPQPPVQESKPGVYVVAQGDTWVKVSKKTLGDSKRWQEIMRVNPSAKNGLTVGMRLTIP